MLNLSENPQGGISGRVGRKGPTFLGRSNNVEQGRELMVLENVQKSYRGHCVLAIERLVLYSGDRIVVTGGNGSGRSTLMRLLAGVALSDRGGVWRAPELSREILGLVPQSAGLYGELSVEANLHLRRRLYGL